MLQGILNEFGADRYNPMLMALTGDAIIVFLYISFNTIISVSFFIISFCLIRAGFTEFRISGNVKMIMGVVGVLCGLSYVVDTITIYSAVYRLDVFVRAAMATSAAVTAYFVAREYSNLRGK